jgi:trans-aconitate methyltransferase
MSPQIWNPSHYREHAAFVPALGLPVLELLDPKPGERVLDLGCGDGTLTRALIARGCEVVGVDASPELTAVARAAGVDARVTSGEALTFAAEFDAVFSNAALHWMKDGASVARGAFRALRPGGRFVGELGGAGNVARIEGALIAALDRRGLRGASYSPWYFPSADEYRALLEHAGFVVDTIELFARPTDLPGDVRSWLETMARCFADPLPRDERDTYLDEVCAALQSALRRADGTWWADYVRLRFSAHRPA